MAIAAASVAWFSSLPTPVKASVVIGGTRVIYMASEPEVTLKLSNEGRSPALVQSWIDAGDVKSAPTTVNAPFVVTPPISRIDPGKSQTLRIVYTGEPLPHDRESVYWLDVLEVPPKPRDAADVNRVQIAFRSRIKLFYRPEKLKGTSADAPSQIHWRLIRAAGKQTLEGHNPTQYYISLVDVTLLSGPHKATADGGIIGPGETHAFPLSGEEIEAAGAKVHYTTVNDYGAFVDGETPVLPSGAALLK